MGTMLAQVLALAVALASLALYMAAFFLPEVYRKFDFIWSGVAMFYALVLWVYAPAIQGGLLIGNVACVVLLTWMGWQVLKMRRQMTPFEQQTWMPEGMRSPADVLQYQWRHLRTKLPLPTGLKPKPEPQMPTAVLETSPSPVPTKSPVIRQPKPRYKRPLQGVPQQPQESSVKQLRPEKSQDSLPPSFQETRTHPDETAAASGRCDESLGSAISRGTAPEQPVAIEVDRMAAIAPDASTAANAVAPPATPTRENHAQAQDVAASPGPKKRSILVLPRTKKKNWFEKFQDWVMQPFARRATTQTKPTQPIGDASTSAAPTTGEANLDDFDFDFDAPATAATIAEPVSEVPAAETTIVTLDETLAAEVVGSDVSLPAVDAEIVTLDATLAEEVAAESVFESAPMPPRELPEIQVVAFEETGSVGETVAAEAVSSTAQAIAPETALFSETAVEPLAATLPEEGGGSAAPPPTAELLAPPTAEVMASGQSQPSPTLAEMVAEELALSEAIAQKIVEARQIGSSGLVGATPPQPTSSPEPEHETGVTAAALESPPEVRPAPSVAAAPLPTHAPPVEFQGFPGSSEVVAAATTSEEAIASTATTGVAIAAAAVLQPDTPVTAAEPIPVPQGGSILPDTVAPPTPEEPPTDNLTLAPESNADLENELDRIFVLPPDVSLVEAVASPKAVPPIDSHDSQWAEPATLPPPAAASLDNHPPDHLSQAAPSLSEPTDANWPEDDLSQVTAAPPEATGTNWPESATDPGVPEAIAPSPSLDFVSELRDLLAQSDRQSSELPSLHSAVGSALSEPSSPSRTSPFWDAATPDLSSSDLTRTLQSLLNTSDPNPSNLEDPQ